MSQTLDSIRHILNRECDMTTDVEVDVSADMDVDMADDVDADNPYFYGPVSGGSNIFDLLII
jgi:hypothetical protein